MITFFHPFGDLPLTRIKIFLASLGLRVLRCFLSSSQLTVSRKGIRYCLELDQVIDFCIFLFGSFQASISSLKDIHLPKDAVIFDIGANLGSMTLSFAKSYPLGTVHAFEPTLYAFSKLQRNLSLNPELQTRIVATRAFVMASPVEEAPHFAYAKWQLIGGEHDVHPLHGGSLESASGARVVQLDTYVAQHSISRVDLVKIDVEGHELGVLQGSHKLLEIHKPVVIFESGVYQLTEQGEGLKPTSIFLKHVATAFALSKRGE